METISQLNQDFLFYPRIAVSIFFAILFIQSGLDKVLNFRENISWLFTHFSQTFLSSGVPIVFALLTICEVAAGVLSGFGAIYLIFTGLTIVSFYGILFANLSLLFLFFGQRIAKDYSGAASLVSYFLLAIISLILISF